LFEHGDIEKQEIGEVLTRFGSALFSLSGFELLVLGQKNCVELPHLIQLNLKELSFRESLHCDSQELVFGART
jgi:hypothetical protein